ncbi:hypothetical protein AAHA92_18967 [Salvia divinorum]|uniref:Uncharacterized protein n=1 Tax=Salvia divinorum TaxID=28513 RepID=A0ABD1H806_SALDI
MSRLWGFLSDTSNIISSNLLHFATLYLIFVFPTYLFDVIETLIRPPPPFINTVDHSTSQIPSLDKSQLLYGIALLILNISFVSSVPNRIFCGSQRKTNKLYPSLKPLLSSFLPAKLAYSIIFVATLSAFGICTGLVFYVMILLGLEIAAVSATTCFAALVFVAMTLLAAVLVYFWVEWRYGPEWSSSLAMGTRTVAFLMITMLAILQGVLSALLSVSAGRARTSNVDDVVVVQLVVYAALFTLLSLFVLAANTVLAFNGESEESDYFPIDEKKLRQKYVVV